MKTVHHLPKCTSCHKLIVVIPGRAHCFHDYIYNIYHFPLYSYYFSFTPIPYFLHISQWILVSNQSCRLLYSFWVNLLDSFNTWLTHSPAFSHILHFCSFCFYYLYSFGNSVPFAFTIFPFFITNVLHLSIPNCIAISSLNIFPVWIKECKALSHLEYNLRSTKSSR